MQSEWYFSCRVDAINERDALLKNVLCEMSEPDPVRRVSGYCLLRV